MSAFDPADDASLASDEAVGAVRARRRLAPPGALEAVLPGLILVGARARWEAVGFRVLPIKHAHLHELVRLPPRHRDPFDRLLIAQARVEALTLVSCDPAFGGYAVHLLW